MNLILNQSSNSTEFQIVMYFLFAQKSLLFKTLFIKMLEILLFQSQVLPTPNFWILFLMKQY